MHVGCEIVQHFKQLLPGWQPDALARHVVKGLHRRQGWPAKPLQQQAGTAHHGMVAEPIIQGQQHNTSARY